MEIYRGSSDATKQAHTLIAALIKDPDVDILQMLQKAKPTVVTCSSWDKTTIPLSSIVSFWEINNSPKFFESLTNYYHKITLFSIV